MAVVYTESESNSSGEEEEGPASSEMSSTKATSSQEGELLLKCGWVEMIPFLFRSPVINISMTNIPETIKVIKWCPWVL